MAWLMRRWRLWRLRRHRARLAALVAFNRMEYQTKTPGEATIHARIAWHESLLSAQAPAPLPRATARKVA